MISTDVAAEELLRPGLLPDGGFAERPGGSFRPDVTAWSLLALAGSGAPARTSAARAGARLLQAQQADGSVPLAPEHPDVLWPTSLALLAWQAAEAHPEARQRAEAFLLAAAGSTTEAERVPELGHDVSLRGWPWTTGTHSWVEPTALALVALRRAGRASHPRVDEGTRLLLDRQLSRGGWNYGNTTVFGTELEPQPDATGAALAGLAGAAPETAVDRSLSLLERALPGVSTPVSLAWSLIGLGCWRRRPPEAHRLIGDCLARESRYGGYGTTARAMLLVAQNGGGALAR